MVAALLLAGCGLGDEALEDVDPGAVPQRVTYEAHVQPRLEYYCVACHNPHGSLGNAGGWNLSSYRLVKASFASLEQAALVKQIMPPGGARRLTAEDAAILRQWKRGGFLQR